MLDIDKGEFISGLSLAWLGAMLGVRYGMRRVRRERAFDRRLHWYETSFRLIEKYRSASAEFVLGFDEFRPIRPFLKPDVKLADSDKDRRLLDALESGLKDLDICLEESIMFAERSVVRELNSLRSEFVKVRFAAMKKTPSDEEKNLLSEQVMTLHGIMDRVSLTIGKSVRRHLGLDRVREHDLRTNGQ